MKKITFVILLVGLFFLIGASYISEDNRGVEGFLDLSGYEFDNDQIINLGWRMGILLEGVIGAWRF